MDLSALRRWWPQAVVLALLVAAAVAAAHSTPQLDRVPRTGPPDGERPELAEPDRTRVTPLPADADGAVDLPGWLPTLIGAILLVLAAAIVLMGLWGVLGMLLRRRYVDPAGPAAGGGGQAAAEREVLAAVDAGLEDLSDTDRDPRRAVIACWLRLEQAAGAAGVPRQVGDTSTDLVIRLLGGGSGGEPGRVGSADVLAGFAEVYRQARYATHTVDERMRQQARDALHRLRAELTAGVATP